MVVRYHIQTLQCELRNDAFPPAQIRSLSGLRHLQLRISSNVPPSWTNLRRPERIDQLLAPFKFIRFAELPLDEVDVVVMSGAFLWDDKSCREFAQMVKMRLLETAEQRAAREEETRQDGCRRTRYAEEKNRSR